MKKITFISGILSSLVAANLYVSPLGDDRWAGTRATPSSGNGPVKSLDRALALARASEVEGQHTIELDAGKYRLTQPLVFTPRDRHWRFTAKKDAHPVISGGRLVNDARVSSAGRVTLSLPWAKEAPFRQLFVHGKRYTRARTPNADAPWFWHLSKSGARITDGVGRFEYAPGNLAATPDLSGIELVFIRLWDVSRFRAAGIDEAARRVSFDAPAGLKEVSHWGSGKPYFAENSLSFLDAPGEWHLSVDGILTIIPFPGDDFAKAEIEVPILQHLVKFEGRPGEPVRDLSFEGLCFAHADWSQPAEGYDGHQADLVIGGAIEGDHVERVRFSSCVFRAQGRYALNFRKGCRQILVEGCEFTDLGAGAVLLGEAADPTPGDETRGNTVRSCVVHHIGVVYPSAVGIWVGYSGSNRILSNHLHHLPYTGISIGWGWDPKPNAARDNLVEGNRLHDIQELMGDGGGIYAQSVQPGTIIRDNVVYDVHGQMTYGTGIYLDNHCAGITVSNNFVARTIGASIPCNDPSNNLIANNMLVFPATGVFHINKPRGNRYERNLAYLSEGSVVEDRGERKYTMDRNLYWHTKGVGALRFAEGMGLDEWRKRGMDGASVVVDPGFKDPAGGDFTPDWPALERAGFARFAFQIPNIGRAPEDRRTNARLAKLFNLPMEGGRTAQALAMGAPTREDGLVAWWPFENPAGAENAAKAMHGLLVGEPKLVEGIRGKALAFDGSSDRVEIKATPGLDVKRGVTLCAWVKIAPEQKYKREAGPAPVHAGIFDRSGTLRLTVVENAPPYSVKFGLKLSGRGLCEVASPKSIPADSWVFVAGAYDVSTGRLTVWVNGNPTGSQAVAPGTPAEVSGNLILGARDLRSHFAGVIDEARYFTRALGDPELAIVRKETGR